MDEFTVAYLGLGSNLGDRQGTLRRALERLAESPRIRLDLDADVASLYETDPQGGPPGQPRFLNTAARLSTPHTPFHLLGLMQRIEADLGRVRAERWGPRTIDIDLLLMGDLIVESDALTIPHPRLAERRFVIEPLAELAADVVHPRLGLTIAQLAQQARVEPAGDEVVRLSGPGWTYGEQNS